MRLAQGERGSHGGGGGGGLSKRELEDKRISELEDMAKAAGVEPVPAIPYLPVESSAISVQELPSQCSVFDGEAAVGPSIPIIKVLSFFLRLNIFLSKSLLIFIN